MGKQADGANPGNTGNYITGLEDNYNKRYEGFDPNSPESNIIFEFMTDKIHGAKPAICDSGTKRFF